MKSIVVFCGSSPGKNPEICEIAHNLGKKLAEEKIRVIYGGAQAGVMGAVANGCLENGGEVIGALPHFLSAKEIRHHALTEMFMVDSMHERKMKMNELSDGVIALPGGFGTLEELFEMLTWAQLGLHQKPIGILNIAGYFNHLFQFFEVMMSENLLKEKYRSLVLKSAEIGDLLLQIRNFQPIELEKWMKNEET